LIRQPILLSVLIGAANKTRLADRRE